MGKGRRHGRRREGRRLALLGVALALALSAAGAAGVKSGVASDVASGVTGRKQTEPPPPVSARFQEEIGRLTTGGGRRLKEAQETPVDRTGARYLAAIFENVTTTGKSGEGYELHIFVSREANAAGSSGGSLERSDNNHKAQAAQAIFTRKEFFLSLTAASRLTAFRHSDINADGWQEIVVQSSSGGNCWACNPVEIYQLKDGRASLLAAAPVQQVADLNGDGAAELVVADARWEFYADLAHAAAPAAKLVYVWRDGRYVNASRDFAAFYNAEIARLRAALDEAKSQLTDAEGSDDAYIGAALTLAITLAHSGDSERGLRELAALLNAHTRTAEQRERRATILKDFLSGDSRKQLSAIAYLAPLL